MEARLLARRDAGFTLLEVMVSMVILGVLLLGFQAAFTGKLLRDVNTQDRRTVALQIAAERLRAVQLDPVYGQLEARYAADETLTGTHAGYRRVTTVQRTQNQQLDYKTVTVTVTHPRMAPAVRKTLVVAP